MVMAIIIYYVMMIYEINQDHQDHHRLFIITFSYFIRFIEIFIVSFRSSLYFVMYYFMILNN